MKILLILIACCLLIACQSAPVATIPPKPLVAQATLTVSPIPLGFQHDRLASLFHSDTNCTAPCWRTIHPGRTTRTDVQELMKTLPNSAEEEPCYTFDNIERCILRDNTFELGIAIELDNGVVNYLRFHSTARAIPISVPTMILPIPTATFNPQRPNFDSDDISRKDIFDAVGEPDTYSARILSGLHGEALLELYLFYEEGIVVEVAYPGFSAPDSAASPSCKLNIDLDWPSDNIYFTQLTDLRQAVSGKGSPVLLKAGGEVFAWQGKDKVRLAGCTE